jgi:hypothetical protein
LANIWSAVFKHEHTPLTNLMLIGYFERIRASVAPRLTNSGALMKKKQGP